MGRRRSFVKTLVVLAFVVIGGIATAAFQDSGFVPVKPGETGQETLPATPLVFVAYGFVWIVLLAYVFLLWRRLSTRCVMYFRRHCLWHRPTWFGESVCRKHHLFPISECILLRRYWSGIRIVLFYHWMQLRGIRLV